MSNQLQVSGAAKIRSIQGPVVANSGVITALDGDASQYVRGDGTLADFPTSTGGGSSVSYYLNTSVSQGTIGGVAYKQLSKVPISGAGTDVTTSANGYIASYITDANDPALLEVPAGNFNCEFYFSVNSNAHNPYVYAELYKYDGSTFTLLGSNQAIPEYLTNGTTLSAYYFAIPVATAVLTITDRIAVRIFVNVDGRTVTLHTENNHLCQVVTTFSKGLTTLNSLTRQVQFFQTGTSGTDFAISSSVATHTFNLPVASASNTGKLSSTDWSTFNGKVPYTGATADVNLGSFVLSAGATSSNIVYANGSGSSSGILYLKQGTIAANFTGYNGIYATSTSYGFIADAGASYKLGIFSLASLTNNTARTYTLPNDSGTLALTSNLSSYVPYTGATGDVDLGANFLKARTFYSEGNGGGGSYAIKNGTTPSFEDGYTILSSNDYRLNILSTVSSITKAVYFGFSGVSATRTYTLPDASGTLALTSNLSSYVPYTGATTNVDLGLFSLKANGILAYGNGTAGGIVSFTQTGTLAGVATGAASIGSVSAGKLNIYFGDAGLEAAILDNSLLTADRTYNLPNASGTVALTSDLSSYVPYTGATSDVNLGVYSITSNLQTNKGIVVNDSSGTANALNLKTATSAQSISGAGYVSILSSTVNYLSIFFGNSTVVADFNASIISARRTYTLPDASGTLALGTGTTNYVSKFTGTSTIGNSLIWDNGTNVGIGNTNTSYTLDVSGTLRNTTSAYFATSSGNVSIGNAITTYAILNIKQTGALNYNGIAIYSNNGTETFLGIGNTGSTMGLNANYGGSGAYVPLTFTVGGSERMRIDTAGNVGIGTIPPTNNGGTNLWLGGTGSINDDGASFYAGIHNAYYNSGWKYLKSSINAQYYLQDDVGNHIWATAPSGTAGGAITFSERMRITSGGLVGINTTSALSGYSPVLQATSTTVNTAAVFNISATSSQSMPAVVISKPDATSSTAQVFVYFLVGTTGGSGQINANGSSQAAFGALSDIRLKENITELPSQLPNILALKPCEFDYKDGSGHQIGFIAQEIQEVYPDAVSETKDGFLTVTGWNKTEAYLVKAIQEQNQIITELSNRLIKLESK